MEDKELQELFAAKRTTEANRRRQEELTRMINAKAKRTRPLWPAWAGAVAAGIAVLLLTLPALFRTEATAPVLVAQTEVPEVTILPETTPEEVPAPSTRQKAVRKAETVETIEEIEALEAIDNTEPIESIESTHSIETIQPTEPVPTAPRVHRRSSTLLACTEGCTIITVPDSPQNHSTDIQQLLAAAFGSSNEPLTLKTFELK
jgi:hypothetical protein